MDFRKIKKCKVKNIFLKKIVKLLLFIIKWIYRIIKKYLFRRIIMNNNEMNNNNIQENEQTQGFVPEENPNQ